MDLQSIDILDMMEQIIGNAKKSLINGGKVAVDREELLSLIDELRSAMPEELVQADSYYKESQNILQSAHDNAEQIIRKAQDDADLCLSKAQKEANAVIADAHGDAELILREAEDKRQQLIDEHEITQQAAEQARQIVDDANVKAREIRKGTREYMDGKLLELSEFLAKSYNEIEANRKAL